MKEWINNLFSYSKSVSSKRVTAIFIVINLIVLAYVGTFTSYIAPQFMYDALAIVAGGVLSTTVVEAFTNKTNGTSKNTSASNSEESV
jgi:hypothetical protein